MLEQRHTKLRGRWSRHITAGSAQVVMHKDANEATAPMLAHQLQQHCSTTYMQDTATYREASMYAAGWFSIAAARH